MTRPILSLLCIALALTTHAQEKPGPLTVERIMRDPIWMGTSPSRPSWSEDSKSLYFNWNPEQTPDDSMYSITLSNHLPVKLSPVAKQKLGSTGDYEYNTLRTAYVYAMDGDIFYTEIKSGKTKQITHTVERESNPQFSFNDGKVVYTSERNLFAWDIATGELWQLTNIRSGAGTPAGRGAGGARNNSARQNEQEKWLEKDQLQYFEVLRSRKKTREAREAYNKSLPEKPALRAIDIGDQFMQGANISPDGRFVSYRLSKRASGAKPTIIPSFVTESGFTTDINGRSKVGAPQGSSEYYVYDRDRDTLIELVPDSIPGIRDLPDYLADYPTEKEKRTKSPAVRQVTVYSLVWSPRGGHGILDIRSGDNKDRWIMLWDTAAAKMQLLDRQRDEAWIGGPGIGFGRNIGWIDEATCWFQSEATGYSHLYTININTKEKKALTSGNYEVQRAQLSLDKKTFFITTNEVHPGEQQFYKLHIASGKKERITAMTGANNVTVSPDEKYIAILYSYSNKPWELYLQENKPGARSEQITNKAQSEEFKSYPWRDPEVITFTASDGAQVYARVYKPEHPHPNKPAVLFVHGAGYLQNAHKWWSSYFREYMFNNMLADNGYYVMDIDYRGSAGYGRDWRTGIYRHMGGKDLSDQVDAVTYLVKNFGVNPAHIGLYGGSYGGFITLMAMFNDPDVFAAGAALRPVTDWANYNHGYTSNILNEPYNDSIAYRQSSPYYFADGLKGRLLICHGMVDVNVHFQDAVKLAQRLIELGKNDWELAPYPMEDHGFVEPSSWTDEYKRIYKLFETVLKKQ